MNTTYGIDLRMSGQPYRPDDQDAANFWDEDLPALFVNERVSDENYPGYHRSTDVVDGLNFEQIAKVTQVVVATLAELAGQPQS